MDFLTLVGYFVAALAIAYGLYLILRKNTVQEDQHTEQIEALGTDDAEDAARIPVIPRHARQQLSPEATSVKHAPTPHHQAQFDPEDEQLLAQTAHIKPATARELLDDDPNDGFEPESGINTETAIKTNQPSNQVSSVHAHAVQDDEQNELLVQQGSHLVDSSRPDQEPAEDMFDQALAQLEAATASEPAPAPMQDRQSSNMSDADQQDEQTIAHDVEEKSSSSLDKALQTTHVEEWQGESALLDAHIEDQERRDDESALAQAEHIIALYVMPAAARALSGERTMQLLRKFGLRYGEMSLFHRFLDSDGTGPLMFSVLRYTSEGPLGFDLEALPNEQVEGLAFFLALPSKHASAGYDMMVSISTLLAREIQGQVYDEYMNELSPQLREHYRHFVLEYRIPD